MTSYIVISTTNTFYTKLKMGQKCGYFTFSFFILYLQIDEEI